MISNGCTINVQDRFLSIIEWSWDEQFEWIHINWNQKIFLVIVHVHLVKQKGSIAQQIDAVVTFFKNKVLSNPFCVVMGS